MLVTFRSTATDSVTMFSDVAERLLKLMGASGKVPGALNPEDVPDALARLERAIMGLRQPHAQTAAPPAINEDWSAEDADPDQDEDEDKEPPVDLPTRAVPLISLLKRAAAANAEVMWEGR